MLLDWHKHGGPDLALNHQTAPPGTRVWLSSKHHRDEPQGYEVYEVVPKYLGRWAEKHVQPGAWVCGAIPAKRGSRSSYRSDGEWSLAQARNASRTAVFDAFVLDQTAEELPRARLRSNRLDIVERTSDRRGGVSVPSLVDFFQSVTVTLGIKGGRVDKYEPRAAVDPLIEIGLLQGSALFDHLVSLAESYKDAALTDAPFEELLRAVRATYFVDDDDVLTGPINLMLTPDAPVLVSVTSPDHEGARSAHALFVRDLENCTVVVTDPVFLTRIGEDSIASDMPPQLLPDAELSILVGFADVGLDLQALSEQTQQPIRELWEILVAAAQTLGVEDVGDAARLAAASGLVQMPG